ncbi:Platinum sensitivity protein [Friedmanniomyces endolithicus]|nr:Platinum sensitivity protein [Friedmanniomyces endolithicus]
MDGRFDAQILVISEHDPDLVLLQTYVSRDDSFGSAEGCTRIWDFVSAAQGSFYALSLGEEIDGDDDDDSHDDQNSELVITLPPPQLHNLRAVAIAVRDASMTAGGRSLLAKYIMSPEKMYLRRLAHLVRVAASVEAVAEFHHLSIIMKAIIMLDDPEFPGYKANYREYLFETSKFKELVTLDKHTRQRIQSIHRLQYLEQVVLPRILDNSAISAINKVIFSFQMDVLDHLRQDQGPQRQISAIFMSGEHSDARRVEAMQFLTEVCVMSRQHHKGLRDQLCQSFILPAGFEGICSALQHQNAATRLAGAEILVTLIADSPYSTIQYVRSALHQNDPPFMDLLVDLIHLEEDYGVANQVMRFLKMLLALNVIDASSQTQSVPKADTTLYSKEMPALLPQQPSTSHTDGLIQSFLGAPVKKLFEPLRELAIRAPVARTTFQQRAMFPRLLDMLYFLISHHTENAKLLISFENLYAGIARLMHPAYREVRVAALQWLRACVGLRYEFHTGYLIEQQVFEPLLYGLKEILLKDNILSSVCLAVFEYIKEQRIEGLITYFVEQHTDILLEVSHVETFRAIVSAHEEMQAGHDTAIKHKMVSATPEDRGHNVSTQRPPSARIKKEGERALACLRYTDPPTQPMENGISLVTLHSIKTHTIQRGIREVTDDDNTPTAHTNPITGSCQGGPDQRSKHTGGMADEE